MFTLGKNFGLWGIEVSFFSLDEIDMTVGTWELLGFKVLAKLLGLNVVIVGIEISTSRLTVTLINCHLTLFWR